MENDLSRDDLLILVDGLDREVGTATKLQAHIGKGRLHRAFSVVLVRDGAGGPEMLLSRRCEGKYHSGGLWANTCCSHPRAGEEVVDAAYRRVKEELGCEAEDLREVCAFVYRAEFDNGVTEHEYDHVIVGGFAGQLDLDPSEVSEVRWIGFDDLAKELAEEPEKFTAWAPMVLTQAMQEFQE